jgi:predicted  nucleic acid-binding Zn-ribbon protein
MKTIRLGCCLAVLGLMAGCDDTSAEIPTAKQPPPRLTLAMATKEYDLRLKQTINLLKTVKDAKTAKKRDTNLLFVAARMVQVRDALKALKPESSEDRETVARLNPEIQSLEHQLREEVARVQAFSEASPNLAAALKDVARAQQ